MSKQVKDILTTYETGCPHGITFAIHQNEEEYARTHHITEKWVVIF
ncbi:TPA: hypothetical protein ACGM6T_001408 [Streptococcus agalactiae]|nr:hypothetical protein [Streptococcus anginosus]MDB8660526.1 hypothetical protein [Streptococcus anginosus]HEQ0291655.1 hypothetical protein [Streptococcus pyogenes]HES7273727.1 hypothetical protein [Streptococcus pyogenes]